MMKTLHDILSMGGYADFVWPAYGLVLVVFAALVVQGFRAKSLVLKRIRSSKGDLGK